MSCVPRLELEQAKVPVVVVMVDASGKAHVKHPARPDGFFMALRTLGDFGFVADNVSSVELEAGGKLRRAFMGGQAFLLVRRHVPFRFLGDLRPIFAVDGAGEEISVPFCDVPLAGSRRSRRSRLVRPGSIASLRAEDSLARNRGRAASRSVSRPSLPLAPRGHHGIHFVRVLQPDPANHIRVVSTWLETQRYLRHDDHRRAS